MTREAEGVFARGILAIVFVGLLTFSAVPPSAAVPLETATPRLALPAPPAVPGAAPWAAALLADPVASAARSALRGAPEGLDTSGLAPLLASALAASADAPAAGPVPPLADALLAMYDALGIAVDADLADRSRAAMAEVPAGLQPTMANLLDAMAGYAVVSAELLGDVPSEERAALQAANAQLFAILTRAAPTGETEEERQVRLGADATAAAQAFPGLASIPPAILGQWLPAALRVAGAVDLAVTGWQQGHPPVAQSIADPLGLVVLGDEGSTTYANTFRVLVIEAGGNDVYNGPVGLAVCPVLCTGLSTNAASPVAVHLDFAGNDRYMSYVGGAWDGLGVAVDLAGDDTYNGPTAYALSYALACAPAAPTPPVVPTIPPVPAPPTLPAPPALPALPAVPPALPPVPGPPTVTVPPLPAVPAVPPVPAPPSFPPALPMLPGVAPLPPMPALTLPYQAVPRPCGPMDGAALVPGVALFRDTSGNDVYNHHAAFSFSYCYLVPCTASLGLWLEDAGADSLNGILVGSAYAYGFAQGAAVGSSQAIALNLGSHDDRVTSSYAGFAYAYGNTGFTAPALALYADSGGNDRYDGSGGQRARTQQYAYYGGAVSSGALAAFLELGGDDTTTDGGYEAYANADSLLGDQGAGTAALYIDVMGNDYRYARGFGLASGSGVLGAHRMVYALAADLQGNDYYQPSSGPSFGAAVAYVQSAASGNVEGVFADLGGRDDYGASSGFGYTSIGSGWQNCIPNPVQSLCSPATQPRLGVTTAVQGHFLEAWGDDIYRCCSSESFGFSGGDGQVLDPGAGNLGVFIEGAGSDFYGGCSRCRGFEANVAQGAGLFLDAGGNDGYSGAPGGNGQVWRNALASAGIDVATVSSPPTTLPALPSAAPYLGPDNDNDGVPQYIVLRQEVFTIGGPGLLGSTPAGSQFVFVDPNDADNSVPFPRVRGLDGPHLTVQPLCPDGSGKPRLDTVCYTVGALFEVRSLGGTQQVGQVLRATQDAGLLPQSLPAVPTGAAPALGPDLDGDGVPGTLLLPMHVVTINEDGSTTVRPAASQVVALDPSDSDPTNPAGRPTPAVEVLPGCQADAVCVVAGVAFKAAGQNLGQSQTVPVSLDPAFDAVQGASGARPVALGPQGLAASLPTAGGVSQRTDPVAGGASGQSVALGSASVGFDRARGAVIVTPTLGAQGLLILDVGSATLGEPATLVQAQNRVLGNVPSAVTVPLTPVKV